MLAAKVLDCVVLVKEVAFANDLVTENAHVCPLEACEFEFTLGNLPGWLLAEKCYGSIGEVAFGGPEVEMVQALVNATKGGSRRGNPAFVDSGVDDIDKAFVADVFVCGAREAWFSPS